MSNALYRIKIITYASGRKTYVAQFKTKLCWFSISYDGSLEYIPPSYNEVDSRNQALERIDRHYAGNTKKQTIQFEYIYK